MCGCGTENMSGKFSRSKEHVIWAVWMGGSFLGVVLLGTFFPILNGDILGMIWFVPSIILFFVAWFINANRRE